jgi:hypothetical protein
MPCNRLALVLPLIFPRHVKLSEAPFLDRAGSHNVSAALYNATGSPHQLNLKRLHQLSAECNPMGAVQMDLIEVNPEGPNGKPDPVEQRLL